MGGELYLASLVPISQRIDLYVLVQCKSSAVMRVDITAA
jgi:hypothetical protein